MLRMAALLLLLVNLIACGPAPARVDLIGSDTMVNLARDWAEAFHAEHPSVSLPVSGGGSGAGFAAMLNGYADLALASRPITPAEAAAAQRRGLDPVAHVVGWDGLAVVVHPENPLRALTLEQVRELFTGRAAQWPDGRPVVVVSRGATSGTAQFMRQAVLGGEGLAAGALKLPSTQQVHDTVARTPGAVGYVGLAYISPAVRALAIAPAAGARPVRPDAAAVAGGRYPIRRPLYLYTARRPAGAVAEFVRFALSPAGQRWVESAGFVPVRAAGGG